MDSPAFIFCNWESRFWPAKVLTKFKGPLSKNSKLQVEIFEELKQTSVNYSDTKPFLMVELNKINRSKNLKVTPEEIKYRNALRTALNLLKEKGESALMQNDRDAATTCKEAVKHEGGNECTSSRKNLIEKKASGSTMIDSKTLKRRICMRITKRSMRLRASNKPKPTQTEIDVKRKRVEDTSTEKGSFHGEKKTPKMVSVNSRTTEEQESEKGKSRRATIKSHLSPAKEKRTVTSPQPDENTTRNVNRRTKCLVSKPTKNNVQVPITIQEFRSDTEEEDSHRKSKYNQLPLPDFSFNETDLLSSELSMECSSPEFKAVPEVWPNDDTEEDVELPVIEFKKEPVSFERGSFVWCKFKRYPYWPSLVKLVRHKEKRASIIFVEECLSDPNSQKQSFQVSLRTLKHYDCPEKQELLAVARKDYGKSVDWCDALIRDYGIRLGCGFSGSFLEYCTSAISYPVRKECCKTKLNFPSICQEICDPVPSITESDSHVIKKILPDRARASRDRANEKLVECIVKSRQAERHLKGILTGKKKSHWLEKFQSSNQSVECQETYIEDEEQAELVMGYLQLLCETLSIQSKKLMNGDQTKFILEVLFPEAVIFAISATEGLSFEKAEKKFLAGPLLSKRERKQFEKQIMDKKRIRLEENL
ncbi:PWWP domain-containing DNA repair factor 3A isoform X2 [Lithobates pipiens]